jgi:hypothetical protein
MIAPRILRIFSAILSPTADDICAALPDLSRAAVESALADLVGLGRLRRDGKAFRLAGAT